MQILETNPNQMLIGPIEDEDWKALLNIKAFIKDMEATNTGGQYLERIRKYKTLYSDGIKYYYTH